MSDYATLVLGGILSKDNPRRDLLGQALISLKADHFTDTTQKNIFTLLLKYWDKTGNVMPSHIFGEALEAAGVDTSKALAYTTTYETLENTPVQEHEFKWAIDGLKEALAKRQTGEVITESMEILERGYEVGREWWQGDVDARKYLQSRLHEIERDVTSEAAPEGEVRHETDDLLADYFHRKNTGSVDTVRLGLGSFDVEMGGVQRGELILVCGYAGQGKSQISTNAAWNTVYEQGKNVFFATSETIRIQVIRRLLARHSRMPQFNRPGGINSADIKNGTLTEEDEAVLRAVLDDWKNNPAYGTMHIAQVPRGAQLSYVENRLREFGRTNTVDLCIVDYLALLKPEQKRGSEREEFNEILRDAKGMATSFNSGQGVPLLSPWQVSRDAYQNAIRNGAYGLGALADTAEAERSADLILTGLRNIEELTNEIVMQCLKIRDDHIPAMRTMEIDFRNAYIGDMNHTGNFAPAGDTYVDDLLSNLA